METALDQKTAVSGGSGAKPPAARQARTPRGAGNAGKKKGPEIIRALVAAGIEPETRKASSVLDFGRLVSGPIHGNTPNNTPSLIGYGGTFPD